MVCTRLHCQSNQLSLYNYRVLVCVLLWRLTLRWAFKHKSFMCDVKEIVVGRWGMEKRMEIGRVYLLNPATAVGDKFNPARKVYETRVRVCVCVCVCVCVQLFSHVQLFVTPWTVACWAPLSMGFSWQEYWSGFPFPSPGDLPDLEIKPTSFCIGRWILLLLSHLEGGYYFGCCPLLWNPWRQAFCAFVVVFVSIFSSHYNAWLIMGVILNE